jgi:hypothetical protein
MIDGARVNAAVLVPMYRSMLSISEEYSFRNTLNILGQHDIYVIGPKKIRCFLESFRKNNNLNYKIVFYKDRYFESISGYNKLMLSKNFYKSFSSYSHILIVQTDALVFYDRLDYWCSCDYSYIGAPWFTGFNTPELPLSFLGVGNGGFSLRRVDDFIRVLSMRKFVSNFSIHIDEKSSFIRSNVRHFLNRFVFSYNFYPFFPRVNEDKFWGLLVPKCWDFFKVPPPPEAIAFSFEVEPEHLYLLNKSELPFGCHAWEKHDKNFWMAVLEKRGIKIP